MKKRNLKPPMLTMFLLLTLLCAWLPVGAYDFMVGDLCYNINEDGTSVTVTYQNQYPAYSSLSGAVSIPSTVTNGGKTYSVTAIDKNAFQYCSGLTSVTIPNSVTGIGESAFYVCRSLTSVTIPNSVTYIGGNAFYYCSGLTSVTIPNSVTIIGEGAFAYCTRLTSVTIPNSVTSIDVHAFSSCSGLTSVVVEAGNATYDSRDNCNAIIETASNTLIAGCKNTTIPNSVTAIGEDAFQYCSGLTSVTIPNSVTGIGQSAFRGCIGLTSVTIPNSVTSIGNEAFYNCSGLTSVTIPNSVTSIGVRAFSNCSGLTSVVVVAGNATYDSRDNCNAIIETASNTLIAGCKNTTIPNSVTEIGWNAFYMCASLTSVTIPNSVTTIGSNAFVGCRSLTSVTIPNSVTSIGGSAFSGCRSLTSVTIPNSVTIIGVGAFASCTGLTSVVVEAGNATYDSRDNCNAIIKTASNTLIAGCKNTTIPNSVTSIGGLAFYGCTGLTSVTIPNSVTSIGGSAFSGCSGLSDIYCYAETPPAQSNSNQIFDYRSDQTLYVPAASVNAYKQADGWKNFVNIVEMSTSGNTVQTIEFADAVVKQLCVANWDTDGDGELSYDEVAAVTRLGTVFSKNSSIKSFDELQYFTGITAIGTKAFYNCSGLTSVTIPNSVTGIGDYAFYECTGLTSVTIPNSVTTIGDYAFHGCSGLTSVTIPNSVTEIGEGAFSGCSGLTSVTIPNSVTSIDWYAFSGCSGLTSVTIPNSVTEIGEGAFSGCSGLTSVTIPNSVTSIGRGAFYGCTGLTSVTIPNSVTDIGRSAFRSCSGLTDIYCHAETPPTIPDYDSSYDIFDFRSDQTLYVPAASVDAYKQAEGWMNFTNILPIEQTPEDNEITVYCKADVAPYLYIWEVGTNNELNGGWPGARMTKTTVKNGETYWAQTFESAGINLIFNNGSGSQTGDFTNITTDCYFIYNGTSFAYGAIPPEAFSSSNNYVFYVNTDRWSSVSVDLYTSSSSYSRQRMTLLGHDLAGFEVYVWEAESLTATPTQLRFTNGSKFTPTAAFANGGYYVYTFYQNYAVVQLDCVAVMDPDDESQRPQLRDFSLDASGNSADVWNDMTQNKSFTVSGTYFNKYNRNAQLLYSVDGGEWTSLQTLTSDNAFSLTFSARLGRTSKYDLNGDGVIDDADTEYFKSCLESGNCKNEWDFNYDGTVNMGDINWFIDQLNYGSFSNEFAELTSHSLRIAAQDISGTFSTIREYIYYQGNLLTLQVPEQTYTGSAITISGAKLISANGDTFTQGEHFTLSNYANNVNAGTATVTVSGLPGGVIGTATKQFTISPATLSGTITLADAADAEVTYTGSAIKPAVTLTHIQHGTLEAGKDYTLSYRNNTKPGQATVTATGKGNYTGSLSTTFTILKAPLPDDVAVVTIGDDILYDGEAHEATVNRSQLSGLGTATLTYLKDGVAISGAPVEPGNYIVNVAFAEGECYLGGTIENAAAFTIYALDATDWASVKALYNATGGASWSKTVDVSDVKYARQLVDKGLATIVKGRVTALNLSGNNLSGELPATGVSLSALTSLNISGNNLTGNLGAFTAPMTSLRSLNAANNRIATLYPPLPASVSSANLYPQNVDVTLDVDLPNLDIEALMASFPSIFLYDPSSRAYSRLPGVTATGGNDWWASFTFNGTRLAISGVSSQNLYYGASGDVLPVTVTNGGSGTQTLGTMSARLSFAQGDADFNGAINVVDLQAIINQIFAMFDGSKPFNWTAANVIVDEKLNVQDVVGEVNLLLADSSGAGMRRRAPQAGDDGTPAGAANLYWRDGVLYLASDKPVAALDVILAGDVKWDIARYGLTVGTRGSHTVAYSLTGGYIPAGVTPVATALEAVAPAVTAAMLSDTAALEIPVSLTDPDITGVNDIAASPAVRLVVDGSAIIVEATTPLAETGWAIAAIDGKLIAAGKGDLSAGRTQLAADLSTGAYVVSLTAADGTAVRTKVVIR